MLVEYQEGHPPSDPVGVVCRQYPSISESNGSQPIKCITNASSVLLLRKVSEITLGKTKNRKDTYAVVCVSAESEQLLCLLLKEKSEIRIVCQLP